MNYQRIPHWILIFLACTLPLSVQAAPTIREQVDAAVAKVKPALVRIHVVETYYHDGRELKYEASGSGAVITPEGHIITNHHVAGHAMQIKCTFSDKEEIDAELVAGDPLTDIAIIKLKNTDDRVFPIVGFGDSTKVRVGDLVLAMGSPRALSQSVTQGIVSNTEMIMPEWINRHGGLQQDGENVGGLVRWIAHDAEIHGGNSGGPLVNLEGDIIGINEIKMGLAGAIPGNLAKSVADAIIAEGKVRRAWLGIEVQPRLKSAEQKSGALVGGVLKGAPAEAAGIQSGDLLLKIGDTEIDVQFAEQLPDFNWIVSQLPIDEPIKVLLQRNGEEQTLTITAKEREPREPKQKELKQWGITARDISFMMAKELKRKDTNGAIITSVRPGGPAGDAKPELMPNDVIVGVNSKSIKSTADLEAFTQELTEGAESPVPVLLRFERKSGQYVTVVEVGIQALGDPGLEVKKAWLPLDTQVLTRDIARLMGDEEMKGFRVTKVYKGSTAEAGGVKVGDLILSVDDEPLTANASEHYDELSALIRQYKVGDTVALRILRDGAKETLNVELIRSPRKSREMKKYRNDIFEFTVRDVAFFDRAEEQVEEKVKGVLVDDVKSGGWAALGSLGVGDWILSIDGEATPDIQTLKSIMERVESDKPEQVVMRVLRGIHTFFIELEPQWETP